MSEPDAKTTSEPRPLVLIVDDMSIIREPIAVCLRNAGYDTALAADGPEALRAVQSRPPNLILLDIHLGHGDGLSLLMEMRSRPKMADVPVVLLTVEASAQFVLRASKMGIRDYILKSRFSLAELLARVGKYFTSPQAGAGSASASSASTSNIAAPPALTRAQTTERVEKALAGRGLAEAAGEFMTMATSPGADVSGLAALIGRQAELAAGILRVANSAAYSSAKPAFTTIPSVIQKIGAAGVAQIAAFMAILDCLPDTPDGSGIPVRAWQHSFAVAQFCQRLSPTRDGTSGLAYMVGLCHDLGDILCRTHFAAESEYIDRVVQESGKPRADLQREILGMTQSQIVPLVLEKLGLPPAVREPIVEFHNSFLVEKAPTQPLACRLWIAESFANALLLASSAASGVVPLTAEICKRAEAFPIPQAPEAEKVRAEVFAVTDTLARLAPKPDAPPAQPLLPRIEKRIWLARDKAYCAFDPIAAALESLASVQVSDRLPTAAEMGGIDGLVVATHLVAGCKAISETDIRAAAKKTPPVLWVAQEKKAAQPQGPVAFPISLWDLQQFIAKLQSRAARNAA